jgi:putative FmdB family regulatory protein
MPHYLFLCQKCKKKFTKILHMSELEKGGVKCPRCSSKRVEQQVSTFSAVTSKKS